MSFVYDFAEGNAKLRDLLGGKGANLAEMTRLKIPVPPGFTITTKACNEYLAEGNAFPKGLLTEVAKHLKKLEKQMGKGFGDPVNPLLVSVRSGAKVSMPGMMETVLNLGLNDATVIGLAQSTNNERFAFDAYRRFLQMFGSVVLNLEHDEFEHALENLKKECGIKLDTELKTEDLKKLVSAYKNIIRTQTGADFPSDPQKQLELAIRAVFESWKIPRAITYRKIHGISENLGTAVNVQSMVFGNMGLDSGTGVAFTRNPSTGEKKLYGEFLLNAQGEDVVAGIRTPEPIVAMQKVLPQPYAQFTKIAEKLEKHYRDLQDLEFTVERGKLFLLQTRNGKRTAAAAVKVAVDLVKEKLLTKKEALLRLDPKQLEKLLHPRLDEKAEKKVIAKGLPASPGAASGKVVFSADEAESLNHAGTKVILVRKETSPEDIHGMHAAEGILTSTGGMTSHAAVVARGMGKCCIAGASEVWVDYKNQKFTVGDLAVQKGEVITLDGSTGEIILGALPTVEPELTPEFQTILKWTDEFKKLKIRTNADTPTDAKVARDFGAEGIGLCRTEHMFFDPHRIRTMREMILADNETERRKALEKLLPMQRDDFTEIFQTMAGLPVTIRLLDPPLHEFLPHKAQELEELSREIGVSVGKIQERVGALHELNPMLGFRGCRLMVVFPEIAEMQTQAIIEAALNAKKAGHEIIPEIMMPIVGTMKEFEIMSALIRRVANKIIEASGVKLKYAVGTMIEIPRACIRAKKIARNAEFFSFGSNDLTQMTFGYSRDDAAKFIPKYLELGVLDHDPFEVLDQRGVGELMKIAIKLGRKGRKDLKIGICGEHGGEPSSVKFCHAIGLNYVSCSPYRIPIARLAAAQAALEE